ncbi:FtsX-like permease family protein [Actinoplanes missouriensis]|uniref:FtsX-like permease family protein n=1 Tax=Actinoplanes missouriensis TaxID=1866 RepID=UPI0033D5AD05
MSWAGFRQRWALFTGAVLTVSLGVALVQSSLLLLITAATAGPPADASPVARMRFDAQTEASVALLGVTLGFAALLAVFIISSTFAFTVEQRRRELALLRLVGAVRGQLRRLLLGEAVLLGLLGAAAGIPAGVAVMAVQTWLLRSLGFVPVGFTGAWRGWVLFVSLGSGVLLAVTGVLVAARRAATVRPLDALRRTETGARVMTGGRWLFGVLFLAGALVLTGLAPIGGAVGGQAMAMNVSVCAVIALALLGPRLVPLAARLLPARAAGLLGELAVANLRDDARRSASVAAPLIVLTGLLLGQAVAASSFSTAGLRQQERSTVADLVLETSGPVTVNGVPGVRTASSEIEVPVALTTGDGDLAYTRTATGLIVDPAAYAAVHPGGPDLGALAGGAVAAGPGADGFAPGDTVGIRVGDDDLGALPVVAAAPQAIGGGATVLLPRGLLPPEAVADAPTRTFVALEPGWQVPQVTAELAGSGTVRSLADWLARDGETRTATSTGVLIVVMGLGGLYALIGVINSVVIAGGARSREFAAARATGMTRRQILRLAVTETWLVTAAGLLLGGLAAAGTLVAVAATTAAVAGTATVDVPWLLVAALVAVAFLATGAAAVLTTRRVTRQAPVTLLAARE